MCIHRPIRKYLKYAIDRFHSIVHVNKNEKVFFSLLCWKLDGVNDIEHRLENRDLKMERKLVLESAIFRNGSSHILFSFSLLLLLLLLLVLFIFRMQTSSTYYTISFHFIPFHIHVDNNNNV